MMKTVDELPSPSVLIERSRLMANIGRLQASCDAAGIELWPHIKTHKLVPIAHAQLEAGAKGLTCAKLGEAEAMLPSEVRRIFVAHSLVDLRQAPRIAALIDALDEFRTAVTSEAHLPALSRLAAKVGRKLKVMMAIDTGLHREGTRSAEAAQRLAGLIARESQLELCGFYSHEGQFYGTPPAQRQAKTVEMLEQLCSTRDAIDPQLALWPGCSVTANELVGIGRGRIQAVRPGAYIFGDLALTSVSQVMPLDDVALNVLATVVDLPEPGLALIDAGSKTFSSDRTPETIFASAADQRDLHLVRVNEEHGYVRGAAVAQLQPGDRIHFIPAHVCTVVNLTDRVILREGDRVVAEWNVDARGRTQ